MKRLLLPLLVVVLVLAFAVPAMAVKGAPGPPAMMTGTISKGEFFFIVLSLSYISTDKTNCTPDRTGCMMTPCMG